MRVMILYNPRSGTARAAKLVHAALPVLRGAGCLPIVRGVLEPWHDELAGCAALVVAGGDGSVLRAAHACVQAGVPIYHLPAGNENLFARHFGMTRDPRTLVSTLRHGRVTRVDLGVGEIQGELHWDFLIMSSLGPDAGVIHRLESARPPGGGHLVYARPVVREMLAPGFPRLSAWGDGRLLVDAQRGMLVIANSPQYALRINPCPGANMRDGMLDLAFLPCTTAAGAILRLGECLARASDTHEHAVLTRARRFEVLLHDHPAPVQSDGESLGGLVQPGRRLVFTTQPGVLPVLTPAPM